MAVQSLLGKWTVYFALARKRQLVKSTVAVQERWRRRAWWGLEREEGSFVAVLGLLLLVVVVVEEEAVMVGASFLLAECGVTQEDL
jgi:hypothetical protein